MADSGSNGSSAAKPRSHSSLFLSGEADPDAMKRREERLGGMLSGAASTSNSKSTPSFSIGGDDDGISSSGGGSPSLARPRIQVVSESNGGDNDKNADGSLDPDSDDEDDAPPPISLASLPISRDDDISKISTSSNNDAPTNTDDGPSLMETMMAEAAKAKAEKEAKAKAQQRKEAKSKSSFGSMKGGFLNSKPKKKKKDKKQRAATTSTSTTSTTSGTSSKMAKEDNIFELDSEGNMVKSSGAAKEQIPTIRPKNGSSGTRNERDRLRLQEVQDAMKNSSLGGMFGGNDGGVAELLTDDAELMQKIASNPRLSAGMRNPKFAAAMEAMQRDPVAAMERFRDHPEIGDFLREYCGVLGDHFTELGKRQEKEAAKAKTKAKKGEGGGGDMGPLAEAALRRDQERKARGEAEVPMSQGEEEMMQKIVADPEMAQILMDPAMQIIMQECAMPGRMHAYMNHPEYGPKLRKLMQVGLLKVG